MGNACGPQSQPPTTTDKNIIDEPHEENHLSLAELALQDEGKELVQSINVYGSGTHPMSASNSECDDAVLHVVTRRTSQPAPSSIPLAAAQTSPKKRKPIRRASAPLPSDFVSVLQDEPATIASQSQPVDVDNMPFAVPAVYTVNVKDGDAAHHALLGIRSPRSVSLVLSVPDDTPPLWQPSRPRRGSRSASGPDQNASSGTLLGHDLVYGWTPTPNRTPNDSGSLFLSLGSSTTALVVE